MKPETKKIKIRRYRVKVGDSYCKLNYNFHESGAVIPGYTQEQATVFNAIVSAKAAILRTMNTQAEVKKGMYADTPIFAPLMFKGTPKLEEFTVEVEPEEQGEQL